MENTFPYSEINLLQEKEDLQDRQSFAELAIEQEFTSLLINNLLQ